MIFYYILIVLLILYIQKQYANETLSLIVGVFFLITTKSDSLLDFRLSLTSSIKKLLFSEQVLMFLLIFILVLLISELTLFLGVQRRIEKTIDTKSRFIRKTYMHLFSSLSSNLEVEDTYFGDKYGTIFRSSAFIMSTLNIFALVPITSYFVVLIIFDSFSSQQLIFFLFFSNYFAIYWFFKRIIDFRHATNIEYKYDEDKLSLKTKTKFRYDYYVSDHKLFSYRYLIYLTIGIGAFYYFNNFLIGAIFCLILIFLDLLMIAVLFAFHHQEIDELFLYELLVSGSKKLLKNVTNILLGILFVLIATELLTSFSYLLVSETLILYIVLGVVGVIGTYYTKNVTLVIILVVPIFYLLYRGNISGTLEIQLISIYITFLFMVRHFSLIHINLKNRLFRVDFIYQLIVIFTAYTTLFITKNILLGLIPVFISLLIYNFIIVKIMKKK